MSVSNQAKRRGTILDEIMMYHRQQLPKTMREVPLADLRAVVGLATPPLDFLAAVKSPGVSLIAECKKASPSRGLIAPRYNAAEIAETYVRGGARAISVLTDGRHFQGSLADLSAVKEALRAPGRLIPDKKDPRRARGIPVLRKDFIFHPYQLYEARAAGADAVLLIAAVLEGGDLGSLLQLARELGMEALVEVHTEAELARALQWEPRIIGVNNRNLQTFAVDFDNTARLRKMIPPAVAVVAESGLKTADDVRTMRDMGVDAVLVGETLMRSRDVVKMTRVLVNAGISAPPS